MKLPAALSEEEALDEIRSIAKKNKLERSFIGEGFYGTYMPTVILRNVYENPGWYTGYTPYQAEISQGRLEGSAELPDHDLRPDRPAHRQLLAAGRGHGRRGGVPHRA